MVPHVGGKNYAHTLLPPLEILLSVGKRMYVHDTYWVVNFNFRWIKDLLTRDTALNESTS